MAVTYHGEIPGSRTANNDQGRRTYSRSFRLSTSSSSDGAYAVGSNGSLPKIGDTFPDDPGAWCLSLKVENSDPWKGWTVTADYNSERELATDPTNDPAVITWASEQFQRPAIFDKFGNAICNSAGDPFDPPNMMDDSRRTVTVSKNVAVVPSWILDYQDAVNSDVFTVDSISVGIGLAKIQSVTVGERQVRNGVNFRVVTFTIHLQRSGWLLEPLDAGFRELTYEGERQNIRNPGDEELPSAPVPLNGSGVSLANPSYTNNVFLSFTVYQTQPFSALPLT